MIELTKLNGETIYLNYFQILSIKKIPETKVKLTTGDFFLVKDTVEEIMEKISAFLGSALHGGKEWIRH